MARDPQLATSEGKTATASDPHTSGPPLVLAVDRLDSVMPVMP